MSHLVASIEFLIRKYIETKFDYDALRHLTPALLETTLRRDCLLYTSPSPRD